MSGTAIVVRAGGVPFVRPERPEPGADIETRIAWMRAVCAYNDAISTYAGQEFARAFAIALKT